MTSIFAPAANAASLDQRINNLKQNSAQAEQQKQRLGTEAQTLSGTIAALQAEIAALDAQIGQTKGKIDGLNQDIAKAEVELARQRELLAINLRVMYTDNDVTTLEMLASSHNFSDFMDRSKYHNDVEEKVDATKKRVENLMDQLSKEKKSVEQLLADQQAMQNRIAERRAENDRLLSLNQSQQQAFQGSLDANNAMIAKLQHQQAGLNSRGVIRESASARKPKLAARQPASPAATNGRSYPWANAPFPNSMPDPWGMYKRQCVSYTAWKVANSGRHMPYWGGRGDAKKWDDNARAAGIAVDGNPRVGDVAVSNAGAYGHVMYVEAVYGDGTIAVSQYNAHLDGRYSEAHRRASGLAFIHF